MGMLHAEHAEYQHAQMRCYLCPNVDDLVDTQVVVEGEGILAICRHCVLEMMGVLKEDPNANDDLEVMTGLYTAAVEGNDTLVRRERSLRGQLKGYKERAGTKDGEIQVLKSQVEDLLARNEALVVAGSRESQTRRQIGR